ncbi:hypothetical protein [Reichenbachiella sp.]|uniref:hypothetical protein n=1 Tax=Reichenbachiella sp. TaxID=2184521 RepID=UPI003B5C2D47
MNKLIFGMSFCFLSTHLFAQMNNAEYRFKKNIDKKVVKSYVSKGIIEKGEIVLAYWRINTDKYSGSLAIEKATILTSDRIVDYSVVGESIINKTVSLNDVISIELNDSKSSIYISLNEGVEFNEKFNERRLSKNGAIFTSVMSDPNKGIEFYDLLKRQWNLSPNYVNNQKIYNEFFDEQGEYILRPSDLYFLKKMDEFKAQLDSTSLNVFRYSAFIYYFKQKNIFELAFDRDTDSYSLLRLKVSESQKDGKNNTNLFLNYKYVIKDKYELPYNARGVDYLEAEEMTTDKIEDIIKFLIQT